MSAAYEIEKDVVHWNRNSLGFRLPTESEWESVANIGMPANLRNWENSILNNAKHDSLEEYAHFGSPSTGTLRVGQKNPNTLGIYDLMGNVFEWCWDEFQPYNDIPKVYPVSNSTQEHQLSTIRVCRGGSWNRDAWFYEEHTDTETKPQQEPKILVFVLFALSNLRCLPTM